MNTCLERLLHWLESQQVPFLVHHHRAVATLADVPAALHEQAEHVARTVVASVDERLVMLVVPTPAEVDFRRVERLLEAQSAAPVSEHECELRFSDCEPGAMPPFGQLYDMPTYIDGALARGYKFVFPAGSHRVAIKLPTAHYLRLARPILCRLTLPAGQAVSS